MVNENQIRRIETALTNLDDITDVHFFITETLGLTGYDAWLAFQAAKVSLRMFERTYVEQ